MKDERLTKEEEHHLIDLAQHGDKEATKILIANYKNMIRKMAINYFKDKKDVELVEIYEEGLLGFLEAIERFNLSKDVYLSTFAFYWIKKKMLEFLIVDNDVSMTQEDFKLVSAYAEIEKEYQDAGIVPSLDDYANRMHISRKRVLELVNLHKRALSLNDDSVDKRIKFTDYFSQSVEEIIVQDDLKDQIRELFVLAKLKEKHIEVLNLRFGLTGLPPMKLEEIADLLDTKPECVRQLESRALKRIRLAQACSRLLIYSENYKMAADNLRTFREHYKTPHAKLVKKISQIKGR